MRAEGLGRFLVYVLGHRPDEFGLVPDGEGFVPSKELIQALHEEEAWRYVRQSHIHEILLGDDRDRFESREGGIRSIDRRWRLDLRDEAPSPPKILFTPIRRRAHPVVMEKGLKGGEDRPLVLSADKDMALRIGRRRDQAPVLLEIMAGTASEKGIRFYPFGDLFLTSQIPARFIAGPPAPKETAESGKEKDRTGHTSIPKGPVAPTPGTFILDPSRDPDRYRKGRGKKPKGWKEAARKMRKG
jgi:putative RNA 2'-phosphotransferase